MIPLERVRSKQAIPPSFRGKLRVNKALTLLPAPGAARAFDSKHWKKAKAQLKVETHGKCAYCEAPTSTVAYGDVEHFRPKSVYWWLAYCYDNYLFSCQICSRAACRAPAARPSRRCRQGGVRAGHVPGPLGRGGRYGVGGVRRGVPQ